MLPDSHTHFRGNIAQVWYFNVYLRVFASDTSLLRTAAGLMLCRRALCAVLPMCELYVSCARLQAALVAVPVFWFGDCQGVQPVQRAAVASTFLFSRNYVLIMFAVML